MSGAVAIYLRISVDDENRSESDSIINQRNLLRSYIAAAPTLSAGEVLEFSDDGWSGTNFNRPKVQELLELARFGVIRCIVVKDLSRWGRNYPEVNEYLDQIFPFLGIRFISVNDHYDSNDYKGATAPIDVAFSSIMHDMYCKELSIKVKQSHLAKAQKGEYVTGTVPFGYLRSKEKKNQLVIDEGAAVIIRRIFDMACNGISTIRIAATLNEDGVATPLIWRKRNGRSMLGYKLEDSKQTYWENSVIRKILRDERYTGMMVCFKAKRTSPGCKRQTPLPESEWLKVPNSHEAIVSSEQFDRANSQLRTNKSSPHSGSKTRAPFKGKIFCGHCGLALTLMDTLNSYYYCRRPKLKTKQGCSEDKIPLESLKGLVLTVVQAEARKVYDSTQQRKQATQHSFVGENTIAAEHKRLKSQIALLERRSISLYEDFADGKLDKADYIAAKTVCATELSETESRIAELDTRMNDADPVVQPSIDEPFLHRILDATELTKEVLSLVERITVYDSERIEIKLAFGDVNQ